MLKKVKLDKAIGLTIGHDMTKVVPGKFKGPMFRRGHVITREDIPELRLMGKEHIYVIEEEEGWVHEEEAALRIARAVSSPDMQLTDPKEGRVSIISTINGLLKVNRALLREINSIKNIVLATRHDNTLCQPGTIVAATKIVPLGIPEADLATIEELCHKQGKVLHAIPFKTKKVGVIVTGTEIFNGLVKDRFGDIIKEKVEALGSVINQQTIVPDDEELIGQTIKDMVAQGAEVIFVAGGLSVDPDDVTVEGVEKSGAEIVSYGAPVMPGAMFLYAKLGGIPILGAPGAVIFNRATIIDLILPRVLAGEKISREDIVELGNGGLCLDCDGCSFPICPFGR
jgi:molybdenum cofactor synthesis domain-containing protein